MQSGRDIIEFLEQYRSEGFKCTCIKNTPIKKEKKIGLRKPDSSRSLILRLVILKHSCGVDKEIMNHKQEMIDRDDNLVLRFTLKMNSFIHQNRHKRLCKSTYVSL